MVEELERLRTAFVIDMTKRVIDADGKVVFSEIRFWSQLFPSAKLLELGFIDEENRFTDALVDAQMEAAVRLAAELDDEAKFGILDVLHDACMADNVADDDEIEVVREAARILGLAEDSLQSHIKALLQS